MSVTLTNPNNESYDAILKGNTVINSEYNIRFSISEEAVKALKQKGIYVHMHADTPLVITKA